MQHLPNLNATPTNEMEVTSINDARTIVGSCDGVACIWQGGIVAALEDQLISAPGWKLASARSISNSGLIAGWGYDASNQKRAFLLTPYRVWLPAEFCFTVDRPKDRELPATVLGQLVVDGGGILILPDGKVVRVPPWRPDIDNIEHKVGQFGEIIDIWARAKNLDTRAVTSLTSELRSNVSKSVERALGLR
jgi:hypothetical protein